MQLEREKLTDGLALALGLSIAFLLLSFVRTWGDTGSALFGGRVIESTLNHPILGTRLGWRLAGFGGAVLLVHLGLGCLAWLLAHASRRIWPRSSSRLRSWSCLWVLVLAGWVLLANAALFPESGLGRPWVGVARAGGSFLTVFNVATAAMIALLASMLGLLAYRRISGLSHAGRRWMVATAVVCGTAWFLKQQIAPSMADIEPSQPHIVVLGFDSLRTDYVRQDGESQLTPALDSFLSDAVVFTDTITPLARTFPAWVSIVSGRHPHSTGAVTNLFPRDLIDAGQTFPDLLQQAGYQTVYATDEVRFSNLDKSYGFDQMIAPPIGSADFLIGFLHDFPLGNLLVNTKLGRYLFPFAHANRAVAATYDPDTFVQRLDSEVRFDRPTLLAVHMTLAHWPYSWAGTEPVDGDGYTDNIRQRYDRSVRRVDQQFNDILSLLRERGVLDNAIFVLLSDHGESLGEQPLMAHVPGNPNPRYGHGTDVFSGNQYKVLLAMKATGAAEIDIEGPHDIDAPVSLEDIAPTIADLLNIQPADSFDGISLRPLMRQDWRLLPEFQHRLRFVETEFNPPGFDLTSMPGESEIQKAAETYSLDPETDRLTVRPELLKDVLSGRQFGAYGNGAILAALPNVNHAEQFLIYIDNEQAPAWLAGPPDAVRDWSAYRLWEALYARFDTVRLRPIADPATLQD